MKIVIFSFLFQSMALGSTLGLLDTGADPDHPKLEKRVWHNPTEQLNNRDDDGNGLVDDILGWNFIEWDPKVFDDSRHGTFVEDNYKYYRVKSKVTLGTASESEQNWLKEIKKDEDFKILRKKFSSYIHATHVVNLAMGPGHQFINVKYLGTAKEGPSVEPEFEPIRNTTNLKKLKNIQKYIKTFTEWQVKKLDRSIKYLYDKKVSVINGSFGKSHTSAKKFIKSIYDKQFSKREFKEHARWTIDFLTLLDQQTTLMLKKYSKVIFTFSAGNSKDDNDKHPHYPSNARLKNVIAVGASNSQGERAYFSNFGKASVDVFAPGVSVRSIVPPNRELSINGTSQASPQVARLALDIFRKSRKQLTASQVKILILKTSDKRKSLLLECVSQGIINPKRAMAFFQFWPRYEFKKAIDLAIKEVPDQRYQESKSFSPATAQDLLEAF